MEREILIGICGGIGSGKDTVANYLVETRGFKCLSLADRLKSEIVDLLGLPYKNFFGTQEQKAERLRKLGVVPESFARFGGPWPDRVGKPWIARWVSEFIGTECFRAVYPYTWSDVIIKQIGHDRAQFRYMEGRNESAKKSMGEGSVLHVVPDVRFPDEFASIRATGGVVWRTYKIGDGDQGTTGHVSDMGWRREQVDATLTAVPGDLQALHDQADALLAELLEEEDDGG